MIHSADIHIDIEVEGQVVFYNLTGDSDAVTRILINQFGATVWWKKNGAVWSYNGKFLRECLQTFNSTNSLGKVAWYIKRNATKATNITNQMTVSA